MDNLNYYLSTDQTKLHNKFSGWTGGNLAIRYVHFNTILYGSTIRVNVSANIEYSDEGFYTRSYADEKFREACDDYVNDNIQRLDDDEYDSIDDIEYYFSLSFSRM